MTAIEFVQNFGWDKAKKDCQIYGWKNTGFWIRLKRLVESYELVFVWRMPESWRKEYDGDVSGLEGAKMYLDMFGNHELVGDELERFKQAIADVESVESLKEVT